MAGRVTPLGQRQQSGSDRGTPCLFDVHRAMKTTVPFIQCRRVTLHGNYARKQIFNFGRPADARRRPSESPAILGKGTCWARSAWLSCDGWHTNVLTCAGDWLAGTPVNWLWTVESASRAAGLEFKASDRRHRSGRTRAPPDWFVAHCPVTSPSA